MPLLVILIILIVFIILSLAFTAYTLTFHRPSSKYEDDYFVKPTKQNLSMMDNISTEMHSFRDVHYEKVAITSYDQIRLEARYYKGEEGKPMVICFHGYRGTPVRDFSGPALFYLSRGCSLLLAESRGRLGSEGRTITFGVRERRDCLSWASYWAGLHPEMKILMHGVSMGAASLLMASSLGLPENVTGIVADCPFTTPTAILQKYTKEMHIPTFIAYPSVWIGAHVYGHFSYAGVSAVTAVKSCPVPILLIHGEDDLFVPCEMSREIQAAAPEKISLYTFPGAGHGLSYSSDPERYKGLLSDFMEQVL